MNNQFLRMMLTFLVIGSLACGCGSPAAKTGRNAIPTAAGVLPSVTPLPGPTDTPLPSPTATPLPSPTATPLPSPTDTPTPVPVPLALETFSKANAGKINNLSVIRFSGEEGPKQVVLSPDNIYLIIKSGNLYYDKPTDTISARNIAAGTVVSSFDVPENAVLNADGSHVTAYSEGKLRVYTVLDGKMTAEQDAGNLISDTLYKDTLFLSPDDRYLLTQPSKATLQVWDIQQGASVSSIAFAGTFIHSAAFSQDDSTLAVRSFDDIFVYDTKSGQQSAHLNAMNADNQYFTGQAVISPDGSIVGISGSSGGGAAMQLWDVHAGKLITTWKSTDSPNSHYQMAFSPDGRLLAFSTFSNNNRIYMLDSHTGRLVQTFQANAALAFSRDGRFFAAATWDGVVNLWEMASGNLLASLQGHAPQVEQMIFNQDGSLLASRGFDATIRLWGVPPSGNAVARAGVSVSEHGGFSGMDAEVPQSWLASGSSPARYRIDLTLQNNIVRSCPYTDNHTLNLINENLLASITDLEANKAIAQQSFEGKYTSIDCPATRTFYNQTEEEVVGRPDKAEFKAWLLQVMDPLGFTP